MPPRKQPRVKQEDADTPVPMKVSRTPTPEVISPTTRRPSAPISTTYHAHPAELPYLTTPSTWSKSRIMQFLLTHSFSIAPRPSHRTYFTTVELANGDKVVIPSVYRVPLLFVGAFLWGSVKLVLQADEASGLKKEWEEFRVGIVHVARVAEAFLEAAKTQGDVDAGEDDLKSKETKGMARMWRCEMFDRVLVRYKLGWLISDPDQLKEFWENYGDEEYAKDPVKTGQCHNALSSPLFDTICSRLEAYHHQGRQRLQAHRRPDRRWLNHTPIRRWTQRG
ncbi:hypothetical protein BDZ89DRAFT_486022 [Hymenopellis radicata]|nr:hypothetical protein BDZ89DRAFT_486022 [Hymenopellis radicata]